MGLFDKFFKGGGDPPSQDQPADDASPGWDAITAACRRAYPDQPDPLHYGTLIKYVLGGPDPIDGFDVYRAVDPVPHWHYVSYGFSDLYETDPPEPSTDDEPTASGYGFELTFRLADPAASDPAAEPPVWPINLIQNLARYVFRSGNTFAAGHHIDANGPIAAEEETDITALLFIADPDLGSIETPRGTVDFLQGVGITADELEAVTTWTSSGFTGVIAEKYPRGVTDLTRSSVLTDPEVRRRVVEGRQRDGSSQGTVYVSDVTVTERGSDTVVVLSTVAANALLTALPTRLPYGKSLVLAGGEGALLFDSGAVSTWIRDGGFVDIKLTDDALARLLGEVKPLPGTFRALGLDGLEFEVVPVPGQEDEADTVTP